MLKHFYFNCLQILHNDDFVLVFGQVIEKRLWNELTFLKAKSLHYYLPGVYQDLFHNEKRFQGYQTSSLVNRVSQSTYLSRWFKLAWAESADFWQNKKIELDKCKFCKARTIHFPNTILEVVVRLVNSTVSSSDFCKELPKN